MNHRQIKLGDKIEDVTAKVVGIAIGRVEYLDGSKAWLLQPQYTEDGNRVPVVEVQDAYARHVDDGVHIEPQAPLGFHAREAR